MMAVFRDMNAFRACISAALLSFCSFADQVAPPTNDNFEDRLRLEGTNLDVTGDFAGATFEGPERDSVIIDPFFGQYASVWFSWKAPETGLYLVNPKTFFNQGVITVSTGSTLLEAQYPENVLAELLFQTP